MLKHIAIFPYRLQQLLINGVASGSERFGFCQAGMRPFTIQTQLEVFLASDIQFLIPLNVYVRTSVAL